MALLLRHRPDLELVPLRGNVPTRLDKIQGDDLAAVVLACAGLDRLGLSDRIDERIAPETMLPAVGQGLLALETRADDPWRERIASLETSETGMVARAERAFQARLGGDCSVPLAGFAEPTAEGGLHLRGLVSSLDGRRVAEAEGSGPAAAAESIGEAVAETVLGKGGDDILRELAQAGEATDG
jgi:hydroxymethylbilane synthase